MLCWFCKTGLASRQAYVDRSCRLLIIPHFRISPSALEQPRHLGCYKIFFRLSNDLTAKSAHGQSDLLSRGYFVVVLLGGADVGGTETTIRGPGRVRMEDRADAGGGVSGFQKPDGMVLATERFDHAIAFHVEFGLVRAGDESVSGSESRS